MPSLVKQFARMGQPYAEPATDRELIARFHGSRDEAAFAALVDRHGPMVLGACRRVLRDAHAADDAFQATFFILAKKAGAVRWQDSLGGWLYLVSQNVCRKALAKLSRKPQALPEGVEPSQPVQSAASELSAILDEELRRLPSGYRDAIVLCHLQGQSVDEAAKSLKVSEGQLRGRLHRGREKLRERLTQRGVALSLSALTVALTTANAAAIPAVLKSTVAAGVLTFADGTASQILSETVFELTHEVLATMSRTKFQLIAALSILFVGGVFTAGVTLQSSKAQVSQVIENNRRNQADIPRNAPAEAIPIREDVKIDRREGTIKSVDGPGNKLVLILDEDKFELSVELEAKVEIVVARRPVKLGELTVGMRAAASFMGTDKKAFQLDAFWPRLDTVVKGTDPAKNILTVRAEGNNGFEFEVPLPVGADAKIELEGLSVGLGDLAAGSKIEVEFALDKKTVVGIVAEGSKDDLPAMVKSVDVANKTLTLSVKVSGLREERRVDLSFGVTGDAKYRLVGKDIALADLKPEMPVVARFAADRRTINMVYAAPPMPKEEKKDE